MLLLRQISETGLLLLLEMERTEAFYFMIRFS